MKTLTQFVKRRPWWACALALVIGILIGNGLWAAALFLSGISLMFVAIEPIAILLLMVALPVSGQVVQCWPTNWSETITVEDNLGRVFPSWRTATKDTIVLGARILTFAHIVYHDSPLYGSKFGSPKRTEDRYVCRQIGAASYRPIGGESIAFLHEKPTGCIAITNLIMPEQLAWIHWQPNAVGTSITGDRLRRETRAASPLVCWGRNLANAPYMVRFPCSAPMAVFNYDVRFERSEVKVFSVELKRASNAVGEDLDWFTVDGEYRDWELAF